MKAGATYTGNSASTGGRMSSTIEVTTFIVNLKEIEFEIDSLVNEENPEQSVKLKKPMKLTVRKSKVLISYKMTYLQKGGVCC